MLFSKTSGYGVVMVPPVRKYVSLAGILWKRNSFAGKNCYGLNVRLSAPTFGILLWTLLCSMWCSLGRFLAPQELGPWWLAFGGCLVLAPLLSPSLLPVCSEVKKPLRTWLFLPQHLTPAFWSSNHRLEVLELSRTHIPSSLRCSCPRFCYSGEKQQQQKLKQRQTLERQSAGVLSRGWIHLKLEWSLIAM